jgi:hypothetical protein
MTKEECAIVKRLMDENEQLRARVKALEALTMPAPQQVPIYVPVPQITPYVVKPCTYEPGWFSPHPDLSPTIMFGTSSGSYS